MTHMINLPNLLTVSNMLCGSLSIIFSLSGRIDLAIVAIITGMCFDFLDGFTARLLKVNSSIGKQLDSLADVITFGLAPGILMMVMIIVLTFQSQIDISIEPNVNSHVRFQISQWGKYLLKTLIFLNNYFIASTQRHAAHQVFSEAPSYVSARGTPKDAPSMPSATLIILCIRMLQEVLA